MISANQPLNPNPKPAFGWVPRAPSSDAPPAATPVAQKIQQTQQSGGASWRDGVAARSMGYAPAFAPAPLPDPQGARAPVQQVQGCVAGLAADDGDTSMYTAYALMQRIFEESQKTQSMLLQNAQTAVNRSKVQEAQHTLEQIRGQNKSTTLNVVAHGGAMLVTLAGALTGQTWAQEFLNPLLNPGNQLVSSTVNYVDRNASTLGGQFHANQAQLALKDDAMVTQGGNNMVEAARAAKEAMQERLRYAAEFISSHLQNVRDSLDRMAH